LWSRREPRLSSCAPKEDFANPPSYAFGRPELLDATQEELEGVPELPAATARKIYAQLHKAGRA
jgi:hypothetical protein